MSLWQPLPYKTCCGHIGTLLCHGHFNNWHSCWKCWSFSQKGKILCTKARSCFLFFIWCDLWHSLPTAYVCMPFKSWRVYAYNITRLSVVRSIIYSPPAKMEALVLSIFQEPVSSDWLKFAVISNALFVMWALDAFVCAHIISQLENTIKSHTR